jgi:hypothetical protein
MYLTSKAGGMVGPLSKDPCEECDTWCKAWCQPGCIETCSWESYFY